MAVGVYMSRPRSCSRLTVENRAILFIRDRFDTVGVGDTSTIQNGRRIDRAWSTNQICLPRDPRGAEHCTGSHDALFSNCARAKIPHVDCGAHLRSNQTCPLTCHTHLRTIRHVQSTAVTTTDSKSTRAYRSRYFRKAATLVARPTLRLEIGIPQTSLASSPVHPSEQSAIHCRVTS